jgi:hypothetical protein
VLLQLVLVTPLLRNAVSQWIRACYVHACQWLLTVAGGYGGSEVGRVVAFQEKIVAFKRISSRVSAALLDLAAEFGTSLLG